MKKISTFVLVFALLFVSAAAQAQVSEKSAPFTVYLDTRGNAVGHFDEATSAFYAATADDGDSVRDHMNFILGGDMLDISSPAKLKATYTYNVPPGSISGQADATMYLYQFGEGGHGSTTTPLLSDGEVIKYIKLTESSRDQTASILSKDVLPAGRYQAVFEVWVPGFTGWPMGRILRADAISGARMINIKLETVAPALKIRR